MNDIVKTYENVSGKEACAICKGECCKNLPGESLPGPWLKESGDLDFDKIILALCSKMWVIDQWEGDPECDYSDSSDKWNVTSAPYLRPATINSYYPFDNFIGSEGPCKFLGDSGCKMAELERPYGCASLQSKLTIIRLAGEPDKFERIYKWHCNRDGGVSSKQEAAIAWLPFADELNRAGHKADEAIRRQEAKPKF